MTDLETQYGLSVSGPVGVSVSEQKELHTRWDTFDAVEELLTNMGFPPMSQPPHGRPVITAQILSNSSSHEFTMVYQQVVAWISYTSNILARVKSALLPITNEMDLLEAKSRKEMKGKKKEMKLSEKDIEDHITLLPRHQELRYQKQWYLQQKYVFEAYLESLEEDRRLISRQVEIRRQELEALSGGGRAYVTAAYPR